VATAVPVRRHSSFTLPRGSAVVSSPWTGGGGGGAASVSSLSASPSGVGIGSASVRDFPFMKLQTSSFTQMAGLGEDFGNMVIRLEQTTPLATAPSSGVFVLQHNKVMGALHSFSARIHPWYPILEDRFSECMASFLASSSFERGTDAFLVLMVMASGAIAQEPTHSGALEDRPDAMYLNVALEMLHLVMLEQSLRSVQCLVAASIHYYLLLRPMQAHDLAVLAIKKAQNLHLSGALQNNPAALEHWTRVYRIVLLIEGELVVPLRLADSNAWETEEEIPLPTGTDIWSFETNSTFHDVGANRSPTSSSGSSLPIFGPSKSITSDDVITYLLAEIAMRRMLRRNTTAITSSGPDGPAEYAPLVAQELEAQLEQWFSFLPDPLRFSREFEHGRVDSSLQTPFLRAQYWACMVSFYWPAVVQVMESQRLTDITVKGCRNYFYSFREFIKSATASLRVCLPNKWTLYARYVAHSVCYLHCVANLEL
jgi:hypothetical protein